MPTCFDCELKVPSVSALHTHLKVHHNMSKEGGCLRCAEGDNCFSSFSSWREYRLHLITRHNCLQVGTCNTTNAVTEKNVECTETLNSVYDTPEENYGSETHSNDNNTYGIFNVDNVLEDTMLEFTAKLYANHKLPRSYVVGIVKDTHEALTSMLDIVKPVFRKTFQDFSDESLILSVEKQLEALSKPFRMFTSEYMYLKTLKARDFLISKQTYTVGARVIDVLSGGQMVKKIVDVTAKFIPIRSVLQKIFSLPGVFRAATSYANKLLSEEDLIENFVQGELWRRKVRTHFQGKIVFPLFVYFDDFEINNVLGSHAGIQKLGAVYYSIPCFPPEVQSLLDNIFVAALFYSSDRVEFSNFNIFKKIIDEINFLQSDGVCIDTGDDGSVQIYFALGLVLGDNLGLNQIFGFQESFSANYPCRFCLTSKFEMQWQTTLVRLRTRNEYESNVSENNAKATGVKERSVWDRVDFFDNCENYAVDFLHDGPEGAFKKCMALIIYHFSFIENNPPLPGVNFLSIMNDRLNLFDCYHNGITNRPPPISYDEAHEKHIKMWASEMQIFIIIFRMLVGDVVDLDCDVWQFYICLRRVNDLVLDRRLKKDSVPLLKSYIGELYEQYLRVFPNENVTFKLHNLLHYDKVLSESGPITNLSTYRFESKHKVKKTEANTTSSRVNIIETLCQKELLSMAYRFILGKGFAPNDGQGKETKITLCSVPGYSNFKDQCPPSFMKSCSKLAWVKINGQTYRKGTCVVTGIEGTDEVLPLFAQIDSLLKNASEQYLFICKSFTNLGFVADLFANEVQTSNYYECVFPNALVTPIPAIHAHHKGTPFVMLRHAL